MNSGKKAIKSIFEELFTTVEQLYRIWTVFAGITTRTLPARLFMAAFSIFSYTVENPKITDPPSYFRNRKVVIICIAIFEEATVKLCVTIS